MAGSTSIVARVKVENLVKRDLPTVEKHHENSLQCIISTKMGKKSWDWLSTFLDRTHPLPLAKMLIRH